jgi:two-component system chemotaxis response regulator CheB
MLNRTKVFIIDDSAVVREILSTNLARYRSIEVVGTAIDPYIAREKLAKLDVDVITLDIELPRMDGLTFLKYLMKYHPIPVIIVSSLADRRNEASMKALELGAVDIVPKPGGPYSVQDVIAQLAMKIDAASHVDFEKVKALAAKNNGVRVKQTRSVLSTIRTTKKLIAIGASTGGTVAIEILLKHFERTFPPTIVSIHMPERFTASFAERLNDICDVPVSEAQDGARAETGHVYIAPGNHHLIIKPSGADYIIRTIDGPLVHHQRPSVDVMFRSIAECVGKNALGVILTGMGKDGAAGLAEMHSRGAFTVAQDEATSIVFGMPKEAIDLGAVDEVLPIHAIGERIKDRLLSLGVR